MQPTAVSGWPQRGNPEKENPQQQRSQLIKTDADGNVTAEVFLPDDLYTDAARFGFEGVTSYMDGETEMLAVAFQREWGSDPKGSVKIGFYNTADASWSFVHYTLEKALSERGGWVGLSEITALGDGRFLLIERDNQPGTYAAIKTLTTFSLDGVTPAAFGEELPVVSKTVVMDLLPFMQVSQGWVPDKPEGVAVTSDGRVFLITDNDAVDDASGETQFIELGTVDDLG